MATQFTPCPACGAVGEVGSNCPFCGTTILLEVGAIPSTTRLIPIRNISEQEYVERISKYQKVLSCERSSKLMRVTIGDETGLINLNGEIVYPLQHNFTIRVISENTLYLENNRSQNIIVTKNGRKIRLGTFFNVDTSTMIDGIEKSGDYYYLWESLQCKGEIDPIDWSITSPPLFDRKNPAMTYLEYKALEKQNETNIISQLRTEVEDESKYKDTLAIIKKIILCIILFAIYLLFLR